MAIILEANYSKKLGLPGYSSHQYSVTLRTEVADLSQVEAASARLYAQLQTSVDKEIQQVGYLPQNGNGDARGHDRNGSGRPSGGNDHPEVWNCSPRQRQYIVDLVEQNQLDKNEVEARAQESFGKSVRALNKLEASALIEELKEQVSQQDRWNHRPTQPPRQR